MSEAGRNMPLLTDEETKHLLRLAQAGDMAARDRLVQCNLRLVRSLVGRFAGRPAEMEDLFQLGCLGLVRAIDRFDLKQEVRFSTYAVPLILGEIRRFLRDHGPMRVSRSLKELAIRAKYSREQLISTLGREVSLDELAAAMDVKPNMLLLALDAAHGPTSLQTEIYQEDGNPIYLLDHLSDESEPAEGWVTKMSLHAAIAALPDREQLIIKMRYLEGRTQTEIAAMLHVSQVQISRLEKRILQKMRGSLSCEKN